MKLKTSVSFSRATIVDIGALVRSGRFRNKSHVVEYAVKKLIEEVKR
jgi:Arc/MetJ-type ribon-helix-helix transcriptional regulator